ncbi:RNA-binding protein [candidate division KSB1 bacterium]|nr:RNA-binding protein [candidate division KSB1 bacterium]
MNIYVGNLPKTVTEETVRALFQEYGEVTEVKLIKDHDTGELRGFGFIEMPSKAEAQAAIQGINETELEGRTLTVNEARRRGERGGGGGGGRQRSGGSGGSGGGGGFRRSRDRSW